MWGAGDQGMYYASDIARYIVDGRVTVKFTDIEAAGFNLWNERGYREVGH